ncbi:MAG: hypothetical protein KBG00_03680 [Rhodoferax sp.]|uniref:hypothetical protein n=1 Tax=Rhodoferax sp. TaxID=50421 RepID=UPI001B7BBA72|nr:hypothetical protein [Rhodoferax sp.]MBP9147857.1 hypothetical protein [Rhodoferax sp.]MBP9734632.1 hypothetical protein [Rhodoferax sp.]
MVAALSRHKTPCLLVSLNWQVFEAFRLSCWPHAILQTTLEVAMPSFLVFANLRADLTEAELDEVLIQVGPSDRTQVTLVREADSCVVTIAVPWETSVAVDVARKLNGSTFRGRTLNVHATAMF